MEPKQGIHLILGFKSRDLLLKGKIQIETSAFSSLWCGKHHRDEKYKKKTGKISLRK